MIAFEYTPVTMYWRSLRDVACSPSQVKTLGRKSLESYLERLYNVEWEWKEARRQSVGTQSYFTAVSKWHYLYKTRFLLLKWVLRFLEGNRRFYIKYFFSRLCFYLWRIYMSRFASLNSYALQSIEHDRLFEAIDSTTTLSKFTFQNNFPDTDRVSLSSGGISIYPFTPFLGNKIVYCVTWLRQSDMIKAPDSLYISSLQRTQNV